jgi:hypothetical protein
MIKVIFKDLKKISFKDLTNGMKNVNTPTTVYS